MLARAPEEITLGSIVSAVDGPIAVGDFGEPHENGACDHEGQCTLLAVWADVGAHMRRHLDSFTLADMVAAPAAWHRAFSIDEHRPRSSSPPQGPIS